MSVKTPLISIVIPAYNCAAYAEDSFRSVQKQDLEDWEIIFVNDGSTDNTSEVLARIALENSRVIIVEQENSRQGKARNNGISHAKGEWIAFLDADDLWSANKLSLQLNKTLEAKVDLSFTDGFICLRNDMNLREFRFGVTDKFYQGTEALLEFHQQNRIPSNSNRKRTP